MAGNTSPHLAIYGHVGFDVSVLRGGDTVRTLGGAAYYAASAASCVTASVGLITVVGDDFPFSELTALGINTVGVTVKDGSSAVFKQTYDAANDIVEFDGQLNVCKELSPRLIPHSYSRAACFFVTTAPPWQQAKVLAWTEEVNFEGVVAIDTHVAYAGDFGALLKQYEHRVGIVFMNADEYQTVGWSPPVGSRLVVKRGADGASFFEDGKWLDVPAPRVKAHNTTGAGDILAGACLANAVEGVAFANALSSAVKMASVAVSEGGLASLAVLRADGSGQRF